MEISTEEWLETNGLGGFACGPVCGPPARRYHGWLTAAMTPPGGRLLLLAKADETLVSGGVRYELGTNQFPGVLHPQGYRYQAAFRRSPWPTWTYTCGEAVLEKRLFLVQGENTAVVEYELLAGEGVLELRPFTAFRDHHHLQHRGAAAPRLGFDAGMVKLLPATDGLPELFLGHNAETVLETGDWYRDFQYALEQARGLDWQEDLYQPCMLEYTLAEPAVLVASTRYRRAEDAGRFRQNEANRRAAPGTEWRRAADQFYARRGDGPTIVAGFPWFTDWGRDTMIALPGLTRATGRVADAGAILAQFARFTDRGMLPNWFPGAGKEPEYNTLDAALWFFEAVQAYLDAGGDPELVRQEIYPALKSIVHWHLRGTRYGIRVDDDGLVTGGAEGVQLTWMDARIGDWVVTPRRGKPVEIQALWHNALRILAELAGRFEEPVTKLRALELADHAARHFEPLFWNEADACLFDVVSPEGQGDPAIRPNQILAVGLRHPLVTGERARQVVDRVQRDLLTPMGLRTLAPDDVRYRGRYAGGVEQRDSAYHQGTVWPWLLGPFIDAWLRVHGDSAAARQQARAWLEPLENWLEREGQLPEVADGDAPHLAGGCFAQAWSVAEIARALARLRTPAS